MVRRPLLIVALCVLLDAAIYLLATRVPAVRDADLRTLEGFMGLWALPGSGYAPHFAGLFDPGPYALLVLGILAAGVLSGRTRVGVVAAAMMVCASGWSQLLKPLLAVPREWPQYHWMDAASWPSGHATNVAVFAFALAIVVAPRWRPLAAAFGALLTIATVYSILM